MGDVGVRYHGRRRSSLPAMSLNQTLLLSNVGKSSTPRLATQKLSPGLSLEEKNKTPRGRSGSLTNKDIQKFNFKHQSPSRDVVRDSSPTAKTPKKKVVIVTEPKSPSPVSDGSPCDASPRNDTDDDDADDPVAAAGARYNRGRRHSVDVLLTSTKDKRLLPVGPPQNGDTRRAWAEICRVSDPKNFDTTAYEKDTLPYGSSLFQSVLYEMNEDSDEDDDAERGKETKGNKSKPKPSAGSKSKTARARSPDVQPSYLGQKNRQVRFGDKPRD